MAMLHSITAVYNNDNKELECPSTPQGGNTGRFTITLTTDQDTHTHTHTHMYAHTRTLDKGMGTAVKNSLEVIIKQFNGVSDQVFAAVPGTHSL